MTTNIEQSIQTVVDAEIRLQAATAQLARVCVNRPADGVRPQSEQYRLDLCLSSRPGNARACYCERWNPLRFERIGNLFVFPPGEAVRTLSDVAPEQSSVVCYIDPEPMREWFDGDIVWHERRLEASLDIQNVNIRRLLVRLADEMRHPGLASDVLMGLIAAELTIELGRYCATIGHDSSRGGLAAWRLRRIDERLKEVRESPSLPELAQLCDLSVRALTRGFRASRGISIGEHAINCRTDHAKQLLASGHSVKGASYALGFASPASFSSAFRRATGETPGEFRRRA